jgi:hypothetical protein
MRKSGFIPHMPDVLVLAHDPAEPREGDGAGGQ